MLFGLRVYVMKVPMSEEHKDEIVRRVRRILDGTERPFFKEPVTYSEAGQHDLHELAMERYPNARITLAKLEGVTEEMIAALDAGYQEWLATKK